MIQATQLRRGNTILHNKRTLSGGRLHAHHAGKLAWHGADQAAQPSDRLDYRSSVPF